MLSFLGAVLIAGLTADAAADKAPPSPSEWKAQQRAAAEKSEGILKQADRLRGLLAQYLVMRAAFTADDSRAFRIIFGQYVSWQETYLGLYPEARASFSIKQVAEPDDAPSPVGRDDYAAEPAIEALTRLAKDRRAVFFNENHSTPMTRTLTVPMLARLRELGYTHFASETLDSRDRKLQTRGYPVTDSGFYTREPIYGEMVRTALALGFKVVAYEAESDANGDAREREQAHLLVERVLKKDPGARLVVNAGYAHIQEGGRYLNGHSMAFHFRRLTGIDPLTVEQTFLFGHTDPAEDHPYYGPAMMATRATQPIVYLGKDGKPWSLKPDWYDVSVFFPPEQIEGGRPTWLRLGGLRKPYAITGELCRSEFPCVIEARYANESDDAVPADRFVFGLRDPRLSKTEQALLTGKDMRAELYLRPGKYRLVALGTNNEALSSQNITVAGAGRRP